VATADFLLNYLPIVVFLAIAVVLGLAFAVAPALIAPSAPDPEKNSIYECGFNAFDDARMKFDVQFYIVAILFIIVDLDAAFLFPWAVTLFNPELGLDRSFQIFSFWSMFVFLAVFAVGFLYEWKKGALEWR
jgi:NADH-quinone oxidoreductase subunit A